MLAEKFGVLKRVDLRLLWPNEALDFTPWLAQNLAVLGDTLGLDLELRLVEAPVGSFSLDLLAHDLGRDRAVIIENQIEPTDHDHLGKLLTYAAGHDASVAVWVAPEFREEHRQALDWLNQLTDASTEFFGVVVEAIQIDDSRPACNFRLVAFPNDWRKSNVSSGTQAPSGRGEAYRAFFQTLIDRLRTEHAFTQARKAQPNSWYYFSSGTSGIYYGFTFPQGGRARAEVYIDRQDVAWNKWVFDALYAQREDIEAAFGEELEWERTDNRRFSRVALYRQGSIDDPPEMLEDIRSWAIKRLLRFKQVVGPRAAALASAVGQPPSLTDFTDAP
ncbi:MAG: hypothetical protein AVDCRST_MAG93-2488 [uncultured Chloroflexia bacterium]|uniref:DUF4268 domain-containing protein n=1 Tax=uncultured Chloroflexia bacterium TaxID=1672391 RepID=A0A6J4J193_9CHLR|nr:MAG: hypothetical protein AVDCRST_MAG93-2488 [uncultured Chloroflexia bacterium]